MTIELNCLFMSKYESSFWDERYSVESYVYGTEPNQLFKQEISKITKPGRLLLPGEGEGRNAVYAAKLGWKVDAFDQSKKARQKALQLAKKNNVKLNYKIEDIVEFIPEINRYDAVAIIFIHIVEKLRIEFHQKLVDSLKVGGKIILELFSKNQFGKESGGPQDLEMLYSVDEIKDDFKALKTILLKDDIIQLDESDKHRGEANVIRFVGKKIR